MERWENEQNNSEMMIYTTEDGLTKIETTFDGDTVWLSIDQMAELFQRDRSVIGKHVRNIFKEGELQKEAVWAKFAHTAADGKVYDVDYYNLDVIISVGYRVKSQRGVQFRIWATGILKEYMRKGFALDDERLKNLGGGGYFKELLERIRDIRASERCFTVRCLKSTRPVLTMIPRRKSPFSFQESPKQDSLCYSWTNRGGGHLHTRRCGERIYGLDHLCGQSAHAERGGSCQELSERERASCYGAACVRISGFCGTTGGAGAGNDHAGLVRAS